MRDAQTTTQTTTASRLNTRTLVIDLAEDRLHGRVSLGAFLQSRGIEIVGRPPPALVDDSIVATVRNKLWHHWFRRYVEQPGDLIRSELADVFTPCQIDRARKALGIRAVKRADGWWWQPHPAWPIPKLKPSGMLIMRKTWEHDTFCMPETDMEPDGYWWR